jgi:hypothetical protein
VVSLLRSQDLLILFCKNAILLFPSIASPLRVLLVRLLDLRLACVRPVYRVYFLFILSSFECFVFHPLNLGSVLYFRPHPLCFRMVYLALQMNDDYGIIKIIQIAITTSIFHTGRKYTKTVLV